MADSLWKGSLRFKSLKSNPRYRAPVLMITCDNLWQCHLFVSESLRKKVNVPEQVELFSRCKRWCRQKRDENVIERHHICPVYWVPQPQETVECHCWKGDLLWDWTTFEEHVGTFKVRVLFEFWVCVVKARWGDMKWSLKYLVHIIFEKPDGNRTLTCCLKHP